MSASRRVLAATLGGVAAVTAIAAPATGSGFDNDGAWDDEHYLGTGATVRSGDVVGMWQNILIASSLSMSGSYSTGAFGTTTANYTKVLQGIAGISVDGIVGPQTWNVARWGVGATTTPTCVNDCMYYFNESGTFIEFWQNKRSGGTWKWTSQCMVNGDNPEWNTTGHPEVGFQPGCP